MIEIKKLHKYFNKHKKNELHVINDVSIKLPKKGLIALLGPSGSGKTTMLNLIGGLDKQNKGQVIINDNKITKRNFLKRDKIRTLNIGYIFQDYKLIDNDSVFDNVSLSLKLLGIKNKKEIKRRVEFILDKVGMLRYRYRPAGMLSGGERQRVAIARALVKDPDIILADEPTGNLDSKNSIEVMNIIHQISKDKLVILVTHEQKLAKFYADRIIEFNDGIITKDYKNDKPEELDYQIENKFYLKDFKNNIKYQDNGANINIYTNDTKDEIKLDIVVKNGNYYIKTYNNFLTEVVDETSSIEFIDDKYKKIKKEEIENTSFDAENIKNKKYSSIFNIFSFFIKGFEKVFNYSFLKKLLLAGFFASGGFIMYALSAYYGTIIVNDKEFINQSKSYVLIENGKNKIKKYNEINSLSPDLFKIPGSSNIQLKIKLNTYYQFFISDPRIQGSLTPIDYVNKKDLIYGRMPENKNEILIDKLAFENMIKRLDEFKMVGIKSAKDLIGKKVYQTSIDEFTIVGVTNKIEPSIYIDKSYMIHLLSNNKEMSSDIEYYEGDEKEIYSYDLFKDKMNIVKGKLPINNYEIIVNYNNRYDYPLNKKIDVKINKNKLKVVGYYKPIDDMDYFFTNDNTILYKYIPKTKNITIYSPDNNEAINMYKDSYNVKSIYDIDKDEFIKSNFDKNKATLVVSIVIISISLIEAYLMSRSSFLSRVKEVGIYRAIGVKRVDICKMFIGEAFAITTLAGIPGVLLSSYILKELSKISHLQYVFVINSKVILMSIVIMYIFNIFVSLLPVINLIRKTPANILSRNDVD